MEVNGSIKCEFGPLFTPLFFSLGGGGGRVDYKSPSKVNFGSIIRHKNKGIDNTWGYLSFPRELRFGFAYQIWRLPLTCPKPQNVFQSTLCFLWQAWYCTIMFKDMIILGWAPVLPLYAGLSCGLLSLLLHRMNLVFSQLRSVMLCFSSMVIH